MTTWIIRIGIVAVIVIGGLVLRDRLSGSTSDLKIGDCFDVPATETDIKDVKHHPCTEAHTGEVFAVVTHPAPKGTPPLTQDQLGAYLVSSCGPAWQVYVGQPKIDSGTIDFGAFYPLEKDWNDGERTITCYTYRIDNQPMTTSLKVAA